MKHIVYIGIGSNLGNKLENCDKAVRYLSKIPTTRVLDASKWYLNPALTEDLNDKHPDFINGVVKIETELTPEELLNEIFDIEAAKGRLPKHDRWAPRTIDLDILFYDDIIIKTEQLIIPHPEVHKRVFVLKPMCDIEPNLIHPAINKSMKELLKECGDLHIINKV